jgi:ribosome-associated heat shock protein Hsp15
MREYCARVGEQSVGWTPLSYQHLLTIDHMVMSKFEDTAPGAKRMDRWLFGVRLFKSRSAAADAVSGGKVHLNGERVKPSHDIKPGDNVTFTRGAVVFECVVAAVPLRRGPASEAAQCYEETPASEARREQFAARMKMAAGLTPRPDERPNKHDRRLLRQLRGRN